MRSLKGICLHCAKTISQFWPYHLEKKIEISNIIIV